MEKSSREIGWLGVDERDNAKTTRLGTGDARTASGWFVCNRLGLQGQGNSQKAFDALDAKGIRYQFKGIGSGANSVRFSPIRDLEQHGFDFVIAEISNEDNPVRLSVKVPYEAVPQLARFQAHIDGYNLILNKNSVDQDGVEDITSLLSQGLDSLPPEN